MPLMLLQEARTASGETIASILEFKVETHLTRQSHLINTRDESIGFTTVIELIGSLLSPVFGVWNAEFTLRDILTTFVVRILASCTVWTNIALRNPVNRTIIFSVSPIVSCPPPHWLIVVCISYLGASIIIKEPSGVIRDHLIVIIVEEVGSS